MVLKGWFLWLTGFLVSCSSIAIAVAFPQQVQTSKLETRQETQIPAPTSTLPKGAIAQLGDTRLRHGATPTCVLFSDDGKRVFSGGLDGTLRVWDVQTGAASRTLKFHENPIAAIRLQGGSRIAIAFSDRELKFFVSETLKEISAYTAGLGSDFALSPYGTFIATHDIDGVVVTELQTELPKLELPIGTPVAFHPDGKSVALADAKGKVTLYQLIGGKPIFTFDHGQALDGLIFSPDGKRAVTGSNKGGEIVKVWDVGNEKPVAEIKGVCKPKAWIGQNAIAAANSTGVGVYDLSKKKWVGFAKGIAGQWDVSPDGAKAAATGAGAFRIQLWDLMTGEQMHVGDYVFPETALLAPTPDNKGVFILSQASAFYWPIGRTTATRVGTLPGESLVATASEGRLAVAVQDGVLIYDRFDPAKPLAEKPSRTLTSLTGGCRAVALSPDGKKIAYSGESARIAIASAEDGSSIRVLPVQTVGLGLAFSPDGEKLAVLGRDGFLRLYAVRPPAEGGADSLWKVRVQRGQRGAVAISTDGKLIAASSSTQLLWISALDGTILHTESRAHDDDDGPFHHLAFSPDGRFLVSGSAGINGAVQVWEVATRSLLRRYLTYFGAIHSLGIFPDGSRMVSAGAEEAITLWELPSLKR
jgi:WD40 repeat protein